MKIKLESFSQADAAVGPYEVTHTMWTFCCWRKVVERHGKGAYVMWF